MRCRPAAAGCENRTIGCGSSPRTVRTSIRFRFFRCFEIKEGGPVWGKRCTHCMACICGCPAEAIEYGKRTVGKRRYYNEGYNAGNEPAGK